MHTGTRTRSRSGAVSFEYEIRVNNMHNRAPINDMRVGSAPPAAKPQPKPKSGSAGRTLTRVVGFGVVAFIGWTLLTMVTPSLFFRSSKRAVVDVPTTLVTTPIEGIVTAQRLHAGQHFSPGDELATIQNQNVDRSTLVALTGKQVELTQQYDEVTSQLQATRTRLASTDQQMSKYQAAAQRKNASNLAAARAKLAVAKTQIDAQEDVVNRDSTLAAAGAISGSVSDEARYRLQELRGAKASVEAELQGAETDSQASRNRVFFDSADSGVSAVTREREDLRNTVDQLTAQAGALKQSQDTIEQMIAKERDRIARLSNFEIKAYTSGVVKDVLAPPGTQIGAGSTLIRAVDCSHAQVVAVFPRNLSDKLLPGTRLTARVDGVSTPMSATVTGLLPRASDGDQARYYVPFPSLEANEIYVLANLDPVPGGDGAGAAGQGGNCRVGEWVQVSIDGNPLGGQPWTDRFENAVNRVDFGNVVRRLDLGNAMQRIERWVASLG